MAKTRRPARRRFPDDSTPTPIARVRGPADVATMIPYLLGFQPHESLVVVALEGLRKRFGPVLRIDLVDEPSQVRPQAAVILDVVQTNGLGPVLVAAFSTDARRAEPLVTLVLDELAAAGVAVEDAFRADGARLYSYVCHNPACCSPAGVPYDVRGSAVAAEAVLAGLAFQPDRESLRAQFAPCNDVRRREVADQLERLRHTVAAAVDDDGVPRRLSRCVERSLAAPEAVPARDIAWLALAVQTVAGRDAALVLIDRANAGRHFELWRHVLCSLDDSLVPSVGCVTAFAAWLDGKGVLASHAVERVLALNPDNTFAGLITDLLATAVNPRSWDLLATDTDHDGDPPPLAG